MTLDFSNPAELDMFADKVAAKLAARLSPQPPKHVTYAEAMTILGVQHEALSRRLKAARVPTYRHGKGKAFDRQYLVYLQQ